MMNYNGTISTDDNMLFMLRMCAEEGKVRSTCGSAECALSAEDALFCLTSVDISDEESAELSRQCAAKGIPMLNLDLDREVLGYIVRRIPSTAVVVGDCELAEVLASLMEERLPMAS